MPFRAADEKSEPRTPAGFAAALAVDAIPADPKCGAQTCWDSDRDPLSTEEVVDELGRLASGRIAAEVANKLYEADMSLDN